MVHNYTDLVWTWSTQASYEGGSSLYIETEYFGGLLFS